jgi:hypothetical protein
MKGQQTMRFPPHQVCPGSCKYGEQSSAMITASDYHIVAVEETTANIHFDAQVDLACRRLNMAPTHGKSQLPNLLPAGPNRGTTTAQQPVLQ